MPNVSNEFVANAERLAQYAKEQTEKQAAAESNLKATAEMVAETLIHQGLVPATEKAAAVQSLLNHEQALQALNKTAQVKLAAAAKSAAAPAQSMGEPAQSEKRGAAKDYRGDELKESDRKLFASLNLPV